MPRKPSVSTPARQIRKVLGLTQAEMAERLRISPITLEKIENGKNVASRRVVLSYALVTGADYVAKSCDSSSTPGRGRGAFGSHGQPLELRASRGGKPYDEGAYQEHLKLSKETEAADEEEVIEAAKLSLEILLRAASAKGQLDPLLMEFQEHLLDFVDGFDLADSQVGSKGVGKEEPLFKVLKQKCSNAIRRMQIRLLFMKLPVRAALELVRLSNRKGQ